MDGELYVEGNVGRWYNGRIKSELTELKARDTSCPKGKKVELRKIIAIGICEEKANGAKK